MYYVYVLWIDYGLPYMRARSVASMDDNYAPAPNTPLYTWVNKKVDDVSANFLC